MAADDNAPATEAPATEPAPAPTGKAKTPKSIRVVNAGPKLIRQVNRWARNIGDFSIAAVVLLAAGRIFMNHLEQAFRELAQEYANVTSAPEPDADQEE